MTTAGTTPATPAVTTGSRAGSTGTGHPSAPPSAHPHAHPTGPRPVTAGARIGYGLGALVTGACTTLPGLLLLPYLTDTLGVAAALAGLVVLLPKAWAVVLAPLVGRVSDRRHGGGRGGRRPYILVGGLATAAAFALMFAGLAGPGAAGVVLTAVGFLLTATGCAIFQSAYAALPAELVDHPESRMRLVGGRVAGIAVAAVCAGTLAPAVVEAGGGGLAGHRWAGLFGAGVITLGTLGVVLGTGRGTATKGAQLPGKGRESASRVRPPCGTGTLRRRNPSFRALLLCTLAQVTATGCLLAGTPYYARHVLGSETLIGAMVAVFVLPNLCTTPLWTRYGTRHGTRAGQVTASSLFAAACLLLFVTPALPAAPPAAWTLGVMLIAGVGHAGQLLFLYAMLAECTAQDTARAGAMSGTFSGAETAGLAVGPFLFALALQLSGYVPSDTGHAAEQAEAAHWGVLTGMSVLPALAVCVGLWCLRRYGRDGRYGRYERTAEVKTTGQAARVRP